MGYATTWYRSDIEEASIKIGASRANCNENANDLSDVVD